MPEITIRDVADRAGVHISTVSRALDPMRANLVKDGTRQRVIKAASDLGYLPDANARGLRRGRTYTVGLVAPDLGNPFIAPVIRGVEDVLDRTETMTLVVETQDQQTRLARLLEHFVRRRVDGIIMAAARHGDLRLLQQAARSTPLVLAMRSLARSRLPTVTHDDERGGRLAAAHLTGLGHRRILELAGPQDISSFVLRHQGFEEECRRAEATILSPPEPLTEMTISDGKRAMRTALLSFPPPTAVFAHNDLVALGVLEALREAGLGCPADVSVMGYNDSAQAEHMSPTLTTVRQPGHELGRRAATLMLALVDDPTAMPAPVSLAPELMARNSTTTSRGSR